MIQKSLLPKIAPTSESLNSSSEAASETFEAPISLSSLESMKVKTMKQRRPMQSRAAQKATGMTTEGGVDQSARRGEIVKMKNTPTRAIAISRPIARAISFPSNHLARVFETVIPAISQPQPKIMKPRAASLALPGIAVHHELSHWSRAVP